MPGLCIATETNIVRDERGVPHIFAPSMAEAMRALGNVSAEDRMLQMEIKRRVMRGRMAEAFGAGEADRWVELDKQNRILGYAKHADAVIGRLPEVERSLLESYAGGVNDYLANNALPKTVADAGITTLDPWTAADCLLAWDYITNFFGGNIALAEIESELKSQGKAEGHPDLSCDPIDEEAAVVPNDALASLMGDGHARRPLEITASHSWVIAGERNADGNAAVLHTNPQWLVMAPAFGYEYHLATPDLAVRGLGFAGTPGFLVFFNQDIAIGGSSAGGDSLDLFELKSDGSNGYVLDGESKAFDVRQETIAVRDGAPIQIDVRESFFGPVVSDFVGTKGIDYAARHIEMVREDSHTVVGALRMMQATNIASYREAIGDWAAFCLHTIYGDKDGNIAYQPACHAAKRATDLNPKPGRLPFDGSLSSQDWSGVYGVEEMPHVINPEQGYLFTANHLAMGKAQPHYLGMQSSGDTDRSQRLRKIFNTILPTPDATLAPAEVRAIQDDAGSETVRVFRLALREIESRGLLQAAPSGPLSMDPQTAKKQKAWRLLRALDLWGASAADEIYPGPQAVTAELSFPVVRYLTGSLPKLFRFKPGAESYNPNDPAQQASLEVACTWGGAMAGLAHWQKAFEAAPHEIFSAQEPTAAKLVEWHIASAAHTYDAVMATMPVDPANWTVQSVSYTVPFQYNFQCLGGPDCTLFTCENGDTACSVDADHSFTVELYAPVKGTLRSQISNAYSHWVDLGDVDGARSLTPVGGSEDPTSPSFKSTVADWKAGQMAPAPLSMPALESLANK